MKTYEGLLSIKGYGDSEDRLFISSVDKPLAEELEWICNKNVTARYWISNMKASKDEVQEDFIQQLCGKAEAEFYVRYSEITGYLWTDEDIIIGGHDLLEELLSHLGKWLILEIEAEPK
jgi:hypothetical protein